MQGSLPSMTVQVPLVLAGDDIESFCRNQVPVSIKRYRAALTECVYGMGTILILGMIFIIRKATRKEDYIGWLADSIDESCVHYFYLTLSIVSFVNTCIYDLLASAPTTRIRKEEGLRVGVG